MMDTTYILAVVIGFLLVYIAMTEQAHRHERKDLYDRIMARDFTELKTVEAPAPKPKSPMGKKLDGEF